MYWVYGPYKTCWAHWTDTQGYIQTVQEQSMYSLHLPGPTVPTACQNRLPRITLIPLHAMKLRTGTKTSQCLTFLA